MKQSVTMYTFAFWHHVYTQRVSNFNACEFQIFKLRLLNLYLPFLCHLSCFFATLKTWRRVNKVWWLILMINRIGFRDSWLVKHTSGVSHGAWESELGRYIRSLAPVSHSSPVLFPRCHELSSFPPPHSSLMLFLPWDTYHGLTPLKPWARINLFSSKWQGFCPAIKSWPINKGTLHERQVPENTGSGLDHLDPNLNSLNCWPFDLGPVSEPLYGSVSTSVRGE